MAEVAGGTIRRRPWRLGAAATAVATCALVVAALMFWWDFKPAHFDVMTNAQDRATARQQPLVPGAVTVATLVRSVRVLLDKPGGYLSNDRLPPGVLMDNVPNWEFGVLTASRDLAGALRNDFSRSQTQSLEDKDLAEAAPLLNSPNDRWLLSSSESQYGKAIDRLEAYLDRLGQRNAQFYARADNLGDYLQVASARLGSLSQRLSASVGQVSLADDGNATEVAARTPGARLPRTPWTKIDDNFYEARGYTWALREQLEAMRVDFAQVLRDKNAAVSLDQVIRELEEAQTPLSSPIVLNGSPFGFFANHSLVLANYVSRANAAIIELRELLKRG